MNKKFKIMGIIDRIRLEIDQAEVYGTSGHFNQARQLLSNDLTDAIDELEAACAEKPSLTALKST
jgi:hypothetical protein